MEMCLSGEVRGGKQSMDRAQGGLIEAHNNNTGGSHDAVDSTPSSDLMVSRLFPLQLSVAKSFEYIIIPMLIAVLQLSIQESPFKTHPVQTWVFVVATMIYCFAFQLSNAAAAVISGSLSTVSLISIFLPHSLGFLIFIPWSFVPIIVAYQTIRSIFNNIHDACLGLDRQMIMDFISKFSAIWTWLTRSSSSEQEQEQPLPRVSP
ncbi:hypothetical protein Ddye_028403 [Dipteronia dyeriana]|uniref:Uncharacterized protein n=1 Tax=Dipteronia dyeriana TaxID=168575 RepID=A0AAD9WSA5_9ROSI|nr:hypothetical protein Ddye_028403 [Dipteronia dyeriana]